MKIPFLHIPQCYKIRALTPLQNEISRFELQHNQMRHSSVIISIRVFCETETPVWTLTPTAGGDSAQFLATDVFNLFKAVEYSFEAQYVHKKTPRIFKESLI